MEFKQYQNPFIDGDIKKPVLQKVIQYIEQNNLNELETGTHQVTEDFFFNVIEMETTTAENRVWESHRDYYDVHLILEGQEEIAFNFLSNLTIGEYIAEEDYQKLEGHPLCHLKLLKDQLLLLDPNDGHKTGLMVNQQSTYLKKIVFKIKI